MGGSDGEQTSENWIYLLVQSTKRTNRAAGGSKMDFVQGCSAQRINGISGGNIYILGGNLANYTEWECSGGSLKHSVVRRGGP